MHNEGEEKLLTRRATSNAFFASSLLASLLMADGVEAGVKDALHIILSRASKDLRAQRQDIEIINEREIGTSKLP